jgi:hypothetical protein
MQVAPILIVVLLVAVVMVAYLYVRRRQPHRIVQSTSAGQPPEDDLGPDLKVETLQPGDVLALWDGKEVLVERVVECQESLPVRVTRWRWVFLEGGQMLGVTPAGNTLYADTKVLRQGTAPYDQLASDVEAGGVLKLFEARVRDGSVGRDPVFWDFESQRYQLQATGTFSAPDQAFPQVEVWRDVSADEAENVYFRMVGPEGAQVLGIWTSHIALLVGRVLTQTDVREIYRAGRRS